MTRRPCWCPDPDAVDVGYCECGCGGRTKIATKHDCTRGYIKGRPKRYLRGHSNRMGGRRIMTNGYVGIRMPDHPRALGNHYVYEHILIAESVLGKRIPQGAEVHHSNGNKEDNRRGNLVICESHGYHMSLHRRQRALDACGHASWRKCQYCKKYDSPENVIVESPRSAACHRSCLNAYRRDRRRIRQLRALTEAA